LLWDELLCAHAMLRLMMPAAVTLCGAVICCASSGCKPGSLVLCAPHRRTHPATPLTTPCATSCRPVRQHVQGGKALHPQAGPLRPQELRVGLPGRCTLHLQCHPLGERPDPSPGAWQMHAQDGHGCVQRPQSPDVFVCLHLHGSRQVGRWPCSDHQGCHYAKRLMLHQYALPILSKLISAPCVLILAAAWTAAAPRETLAACCQGSRTSARPALQGAGPSPSAAHVSIPAGPSPQVQSATPSMSARECMIIARKGYLMPAANACLPQQIFSASANIVVLSV
jgi:hypothetical protein